MSVAPGSDVTIALSEAGSNEIQSQRCDWISFDPASLKAIVTSLPGAGDISLPVDVGQVVSFLGR